MIKQDGSRETVTMVSCQRNNSDGLLTVITKDTDGPVVECMVGDLSEHNQDDVERALARSSTVALGADTGMMRQTRKLPPHLRREAPRWST